NRAALDAVFRTFHTIKGVSGYIDLDDVQALAHESENLLDQSRKGQIVLEGAYLDIVFDAIDMLKKLLGLLRVALSEDAPLQSSPELPELIGAIRDLATGKAGSKPSSINAAATGMEPGAASGSAEAALVSEMAASGEPLN